MESDRAQDRGAVAAVRPLTRAEIAEMRRWLESEERFWAAQRVWVSLEMARRILATLEREALPTTHAAERSEAEASEAEGARDGG